MWKTLKQQLWQYRGILIAAPGVTFLILMVRFTGLLELLELAALDQFFRARAPESVDSRIVIVEINKRDTEQLNFPVSDRDFAQLITTLKKHNPIAIGLDIYRDKPVSPGHQELVKVFESTPNLIGVQKVGESLDSLPVSPPPVLKKLGQVGANDLPTDRDGKIRRILIYVAEKPGTSIFSFSWKLAYFYLKDKGVKVTQTDDLLVKVGSTILPLFHSYDGGYIRAEEQGYQVLINYRGSRQSFPVLSMVDVLNNRFDPESIRGRIVLIGSTDESLKDLFYTPYSGSLSRLTERMPGVLIHANSISQILSNALEGRPYIRTWSEPLEWVWIFGWALLGATLSWQQRNSTNLSNRFPWTAIAIVLSAIILLGSSFLAFLAGWWIPLIPALLGLSGSGIVVTAYVARSAGEIRKAFGRFVTDEIVANLLENPEGLKLGGERRKITILTSDIRGFTSISERLQPEEVIKIINLYLGYMTDVITQYQGTIDEFMGDGILVLFGAPTIRENDADRAIACALAMQLAMQAVNEKMHQLGLPKLEMGIGINTGEVVVGNIGSEKRTKYGIVGDQVNLTYRIENYTVGGQIFITESTLRDIQSDVVIKEQREVQPKGVHKPIQIYDIVGITSDKYSLHLTKFEEVFLPLPKPITVEYSSLEGKQVDPTIFKGSLLALSEREAEITLNETHIPPSPLTNLKLNFHFLDDEIASEADVYAKVLDKPGVDNHFFIRFTNRPPEIEARLNALYESLKMATS